MSTTVLVTGASSGIGAVYADRFARRGHNLVLVARDVGRLNTLADRLRDQCDVDVSVLSADLTAPAELSRIEDRLRDDHTIDVLVNDAGMSAPGEFAGLSSERLTQLIALNVTAPTRLAAAVVGRMTAAGSGAIVTVGSMVGLMPDYGQAVFGSIDKNQAVYGASKAYLLYLSQSLHSELAPHGVYAQVVLPAAVRTKALERSGHDTADIPGLMEPEDFVDAALVGFDRREAVTMPSLPDEARWRDYDRAREAMVATVGQARPAARYTDHAH